MWRALFLAVGVYLILLGVQCLGVQKIVLRARGPVVQHRQQQPLFVFGPRKPEVGPQKEIVPPPWSPWGLMSVGAVVCLYSFSIPNRMGGGG
jgi:hypothetical protein